MVAKGVFKCEQGVREALFWEFVTKHNTYKYIWIHFLFSFKKSHIYWAAESTVYNTYSMLWIILSDLQD